MSEAISDRHLVGLPHVASSRRPTRWAVRCLMLTTTVLMPMSGCSPSEELEPPSAPAATGAPAPTPAAVEPTTQAPTQDPRAKPRPPEPPLLTDGSYTGTVASRSPGTLTFSLSEGRVAEASASLKGISFSLSGLVSGHKISLGGKEGDDFLRFMGKGTDAQITGTWMGSFAGERAQGSWSARR